jgi:hypothetical protein
MLRNYILAFLLLPFFAFGTEFSFPADSEHWEGDFTDYPVNEENFYELAWGWENLPVTVIGQNGALLKKGLFLSGNNHSDDLFMFVRRKIEGLKPNAVYALGFSVLIETNAPAGAAGIGGAPGESVYFKVGASTEKPRKIAANGFYYLNVDKGNQSQGGENALVIGDLANAEVNPDDPVYLPKEISTKDHLMVKSDQHGQIWIFLGTDSGFEGFTKFYIAEVVLQVDKVA